MKPKHEIPTPKESGIDPRTFMDKIKSIFKTQHVHSQGHVNHSHTNEAPEGVTVHTIAVVLDGQVHEVIRAQSALADIFLANPTFILVEDGKKVSIGVKYVDGKFTDE